MVNSLCRVLSSLLLHSDFTISLVTSTKIIIFSNRLEQAVLKEVDLNAIAKRKNMVDNLILIA